MIKAATDYGPVVVTPDGPPPVAPDIPPTYVPSLEGFVPDATTSPTDVVTLREVWEALWEHVVFMAQDQHPSTKVLVRLMKSPIVVAIVAHDVIQFLRYGS